MALEGQVLLPAEGLRSEGAQLLHRSWATGAGPGRNANVTRRSQAVKFSMRGSRTPKAQARALSTDPRTPRRKKASRWLKGRRDAVANVYSEKKTAVANAYSEKIALAHRAADAASEKLASAFHMGRKRDMDDSSSEASSDASEQIDAPTTSTTIVECECGFASGSLWRISGQSELEVRITACDDKPYTAENLAKLLQFADDMFFGDEASPGFVIRCDLRGLRIPNMSTVRQVGKWSGDPKRMEAFKTRCRGGQICVQSGIRFRLAKAALGVFFKGCPPTAPIYLVSTLDGKSANTVAFGPISQALPADTTCGRGVIGDASTRSLVPSAADPQVDFSSVMFTIGQTVASMCGSCFQFLAHSAPTKSSDSEELEELKRTIAELTSRIQELEHDKNHGSNRGVAGC